MASPTSKDSPTRASSKTLNSFEDGSAKRSSTKSEKKTPKRQKAMFVDAKAMKEKLRANMHKPRYCVTNFYKDVGRPQLIARNHTFENITLAVIGFNAIWISVDADHNDKSVLTEAHPVFIIAENFFCTFFTIELTIRFLAFKYKPNCMRDAWFCFDFMMVSMMIFETWLMPVMLLAMAGGGGGGGMGNASLLRLLRLLRLSRMARMARLLRSMPELLVLIKGMIAAIRSVFFTLLLLVLLLYVFSILFRQMTVDAAIGKLKFPTIMSSIHTLVLDGILFDGPGDLMALMEEENLYILIVAYYFFVLFAALTVMNMLIGVLCEVVSATAATEREELTIVYVQERLRFIVDRCCIQNSDLYKGDGDTTLDDRIRDVRFQKNDFLGILQDTEATQLLLEVGVDVFGLVDLIDTIFATETGADRILEFGDLIEVFMDQRTSNTATVKDVTDLRKYVRGRLDLIESNTNVQIAALGSMLESTGNLASGTFNYELQRRRKAHGVIAETASDPPSPVRSPLRQSQPPPEVVPEIAGATSEAQADADEVTSFQRSPVLRVSEPGEILAQTVGKPVVSGSSSSQQPFRTQFDFDDEADEDGLFFSEEVPCTTPGGTQTSVRRKKKRILKKQGNAQGVEFDQCGGFLENPESLFEEIPDCPSVAT